MKTNLIYPTIVVVVGLVIGYYINAEKTELRYLLSDRIPTDLYKGNESESIQQLQITNTGDVEVSRIVIKINADVTNFSIQKVTHLDSVSVKRSPNEFELIYPKIPPTALIKIVLKTNGSGFTDENLSITHSLGAASNALEADSTLAISSLLNYIFIIVYLVLIIVQIRSYLIDNLKSNIYSSPYNAILKRNRPFFVTKVEWQRIRVDAIEYIFYGDYFATIPQSLSYTLLNIGKTAYLNNEEWIKVKSKAEKELLKIINEKINNISKYDMETLIKIEKPNHIGDEAWGRITETISRGYINSLANDTINYSAIHKASDKLNIPKPKLIDEKIWNEFRSFVLKLDNTDKKQVLYERLISEVNNILLGNRIKELSDEIPSKEWERLKFIETKIAESHDTKEKLYQLKISELNVIPLKEKVESQLRVINEVLTDPSAIDRIEDYNNTFSKGNFDNLKRIAKLNKPRRKSTQ